MVKTCEVQGCDRTYYAKGMCRFHYSRALQGIPLNKPLRTHSVTVNRNHQCAFERCSEEAFCMTYCRTHYAQLHRGKELAPVVARPRLHRDETGRVCTMCLVFKPWSDFYNQKKSRCKRCATDLAIEYQRSRKEVKA